MIVKKIKLFSLLAFSMLSCFQPVYGASNEAGAVNTIPAKMIASVYIYEGVLNNPSLTYPVRTTFYKDKNGKLTGEYIFNEEDKEIFGTLSNARMESDYTVFKWKDRYGEGTLKIKFSDNLEKFQGYWAANGDMTGNKSFNWMGQQSRTY
jgi:hypothetical protein